VSTKPHRPLLFYWGLGILAAGLIAALLILAVAAPDADLAAAEELARTRAYQHNVELMGGRFALLTVEFDQWFAGLWHGRALAGTVAALAVVLALGCFGIARLQSPPRDR
jgi:hypothetical protein